MLITAAEQLMEGDTGHKMSSNELVWLTVVMGIATACKFALFIYCRSFESEIVHAYSLVMIHSYSRSLLGTWMIGCHPVVVKPSAFACVCVPDWILEGALSLIIDNHAMHDHFIW